MLVGWPVIGGTLRIFPPILLDKRNLASGVRREANPLQALVAAIPVSTAKPQATCPDPRRSAAVPFVVGVVSARPAR